MEKILAITPTCTAGGSNEYWHCTACGYYFKDEAGTILTTADGEALDPDPCNHSDAEGNWILTEISAVPPTCVDPGNLLYWYCMQCGEYFTDEAGTDKTTLAAVTLDVDPTAHSLEHIPAKEADCPNAVHSGAVTVTGNDGNIEYWTCTLCGRNYANAAATAELTADQIIIPAEHRYHPVPAHAATYDENGNRAYYYCEICGDYFWEEDAASEIADHNDVIIPKLERPADEEQEGICGPLARISIWELILNFFRKLFGSFKKIC